MVEFIRSGACGEWADDALVAEWRDRAAIGRQHSALAPMRQIAGNCRRVRGTEREGSLSGVIAERGGRRRSRRQQVDVFGIGCRSVLLVLLVIYLLNYLSRTIMQKFSVLSIARCHTTCIVPYLSLRTKVCKAETIF